MGANEPGPVNQVIVSALGPVSPLSPVSVTQCHNVQVTSAKCGVSSALSSSSTDLYSNTTQQTIFSKFYNGIESSL